MQLSVIISVLLPLLALFNTGDAISAWAEPVINATSGAGAYSFAENVTIGASDLGKTVEATPGVNQTIASYTLLTTGTPFSIVDATGVLNLTSALDFETKSSYVIEIRAVDDTTTTPLSATATITITVTDANDIPTFGASAYSECIADAAVSGTILATILATDADAGDTTLNHTITHADGNATDFDVTNAGVITSTAVMASATTSKYELLLKAADGSTTATTTITVEVGCSSATTVAIGITTLLVALVTALQ